MKKTFTSALILTLSFGFTQLFSQALFPVSANEKIVHSSLIIEGKVLGQKSFWNARHTMIYTSNTIQVYKAFKGDVPAATIEVLTVGGTVGGQTIEASDLLTLDKGNIGVFFCFPNSMSLVSPFTGNRLYDVYSSSQGCLTYDVNAGTASAPFARYGNIEGELYQQLEQQTGKRPVIVNPAFNISEKARPQSPLAPAITSFSPQTLNAGAIHDPSTNVLTINGSGFGNSPSDSSAVLFDDANDGSGGTPFKVFYNSPLIQSWTDNQIKVQVPSRAGSGFFQVRDNLSTSVSSPDIINVNYAVLTREVTNAGVTVIKEINLMNNNGTGGYTVLYSNNTGGSGVDLNAAPEKVTFQRALNTWKELAGFNVTEGGATTIQAVAGDGQNVIMFDNLNTGNAPLAAGVLATCYSYSSLCLPVTTNAVQKTEFDIVIRNSGVSLGTTSFTSGPCPPATRFSEIDLETVLLHELGHAINLAHINESYQGTTLPNVNPGKLMNYAIVNGVSRKTPDYSAYTGALYCIQPKSNVYGSCGLATSEMTPLTRTIAPFDECPSSFPSAATPDNTTINFDLVHTTSNKYADPAYTEVICAGTGTSVTNNAYYAIKSDNDGGDLSMLVSGYTTFPASIQSSCTVSGIRLAIYQVNSCPAGQEFPSPVACRTITGDGALAAITGLAANTNYLIYVDGVANTKATFTLTLNGSVLPVTLVNFSGSITNDKINLSWKTSGEINSKEFQVEKSIDGASFSQFTSVTAKGNTGVENSYGVVDDKPFSDYTFYRLKIVDRNGHFTYSAVVKIKTPVKALVISNIFPNPASDKINLQIVSDRGTRLLMEIFDILGKHVANHSLTIAQGINQKVLSVSTLAGGTYFIQVKDPEGVVVEKLKFIRN